MEGSRRGVWLDLLWLLIWGAASTAFCVSTTSRLGATFDEPLYVLLGLEHWRTGSTFGLMQVGTMPLPCDVTTLPVYVWERARGVPFDAAADLERVLPVARMGNLAFWWLLLVHGWIAARRIGGPWAGRLAVAVLACEPNLLAHAGLATTDLALTAMTLVFCVHFHAGRGRSWGRRVGVPALLYGVAILAKASALAFVPLCAAAIEFERAWAAADGRFFARLREATRSLACWRYVCDALTAGTIAIVLVYAYCGSDWKPEPKFVAWAYALPAGTTRTAMVWLADHARIFNNAGVGLWRQIQHNMQGHGSYLLGETARRAFWYYFPVALSIKTPTALLLLLGFALAVRRAGLRNWASLAALALFVFSLNCRVQIGIRLVLPLLVCAIVGLSAALASGAVDLAPARRRLTAAAASLAVGWTAVAAASAWPDGLRFTNDLWGGTADGYRLLSDSNYDWGQGLKELAEWQRRNEAGPLDVWYFGSDPASQRPPFRRLHPPALGVTTESDLRERLSGRYLAVGTTVLYGTYKGSGPEEELKDTLRQRRPAARTRTFLIYDLKPELAAANRSGAAH